MITIKDLGIEKEFLKKKNVIFYKAYLITNDAELMIDMDYDVYGLTKEAAVQSMMNSMDVEAIRNLEGKHIAFITLTIDRMDLSTSPIVEEGFGEAFYRNGMLGLTIRKKEFRMHGEECIIKELEFEVNPSNEIKNLTKLVLETPDVDITKSTKKK